MAGNHFSSWAGHHDQDFSHCTYDEKGLQLFFDRNEFVAIPPAMKNVPQVTSVSMQNNMISELPPWGNFNANRDTAMMMEAYLGLDDEYGPYLGSYAPNGFPLPVGPL